MITEKQLENFKGMRTYGKLEGIKGQLMTVFKELYDINIETELDTQEAKNEVIRAINSVYRLIEGME